MAIKPNYDVHEWAQEELLRRQQTVATANPQVPKDKQTSAYHHLAFGRLMSEINKM